MILKSISADDCWIFSVLLNSDPTSEFAIIWLTESKSLACLFDNTSSKTVLRAWTFLETIFKCFHTCILASDPLLNIFSTTLLASNNKLFVRPCLMINPQSLTSLSQESSNRNQEQLHLWFKNLRYYRFKTQYALFKQDKFS